MKSFSYPFLASILIGFCVIFTATRVEAQEYFQQEVNYKIDVTLDTEKHFLHGNISIEYHNNSPDALDKIYMHLWANAYSSVNTAFAHDYLKRGNASYHFAKEKDYGFIDSLDFKIDGYAAQWIPAVKNPDIGLISLNKDLQPGEKLIIETPFRVKIPKSFSRMGRSGETYQLTQWYPKPAVYDHLGWHQMPYLAVGEFYSEFGNFEVNITVPERQIVAASGQLNSESELTWLEDLAIGTKTNQRDSFALKTLNYTAENVHDFAWFSNPDFKVETQKIDIGEKEISLWTFYTETQKNLWENKAMEYAAAATNFFSDKIGSYPYPQVTIVQAPNQAGGGMEYPMITVIDKVADAAELEHVIAHEIGHFWFYGILGFNERLHPWMDEGLTTYYDHEYYYGRHGVDHFTSSMPKFVCKHFHRSATAEGYLLQASRHFDQGIDQGMSSLSKINYGIGAYVKPAVCFYHLEHYLGKEKLDSWLQSFYEKWKFKHPYPKDLKSHLEKESGQDLSWLFEGLLQSDGYVDYAIENYNGNDSNATLTVTNNGKSRAPFKISAIKNKMQVLEQWAEGFEGTKEIEILAGDYDRIEIAADHYSLDIDPSDNHIKTKGLFKKSESTNYGFGGGPNNLKGNKRYLLPSIGYNSYDGFQLGIVDYSALSPSRKWQDAGVLNFGLRSGEIVGVFKLRYNHFYDSDKPKFLHADLEFKRFNYNYFERFDQSVSYSRISPSVSYHFKDKFNGIKNHTFKYQLHLINKEFPQFENDQLTIFDQWNNVHQLSYNFDRPHTLFPYEYNAKLEFANYKNAVRETHNYLKLDMSFKVDLQYKMDKFFQFRFYGAGFLKNTQRNSGSTSPSIVNGTIPYTYQGFNDYNYEEYFFGRTEQEGIWSRQISLQGGGFKTATTSAFNTVGQSNDFLFSMNLKSDFPFKIPFNLPLKAFFDMAQFNSKTSEERDFNTKTFFSAGLALEIGDGALGFYLPVFNSSEIGTALDNRGSGLFKRWSFSLDLTKLNAWKGLDQIGYK